MAIAFLDILLGWLLYLHPALGIFLISILISLVVTLAIKVFTNQSLMKDLRDELKELQKEMKTLKNNPKKLSQVNSQFMETNMKYMSHSMRPTLFTFIPIILVFGWLNSHIAYYPLLPNQSFELKAEFDKDQQGIAELKVPEGLKILDTKTKEITGNEAKWALISEKEGAFNAELSYNGKTYVKEILITNERKYSAVEKSFRKGFLFFTSSDNGLNKITLGNEKILPFHDVLIIKEIPWISTWGWLGAYFIFSIGFSILFRKVFNIY